MKNIHDSILQFLDFNAVTKFIISKTLVCVYNVRFIHIYDSPRIIWDTEMDYVVDVVKNVYYCY